MGFRSWATNAALRLLDGERHAAFQDFYRGVRYRRLSQPQAQFHWDRLSEVESLRHELRAAWSWSSSQALGRAYRAARSLEGDRRTHSAEEQVAFGGLYMGIVLGRVSLSQLKQEPFSGPRPSPTDASVAS